MSNDQSVGCCDEPPCPSVSFLCDSVSASKSKCGYVEFETPSSPPKKYLTQYCVYSNDFSGTCYGDTLYEYDVVTCNLTITSSFGVGCPAHTDIGPYTKPCVFGGSGGCISPISCGTACGVDTCAVVTSTTSANSQQPLLCSPARHYIFATADLSNEYTTTQLKTNTTTAIPSYFGHFGCEENEEIGFRTTGQNCVCFAARHLSTDETSYTVVRFKYIVEFQASVTCGLIILWNETFKPTLTIDTSFCGTDYHIGDEDPRPSSWSYTARVINWSGSGDPCGPASLQAGPYTVNEPSTNGTIYLTDLRWSILDGNNDTDLYLPNPTNYSNPCSPTPADPNCIPAE